MTGKQAAKAKITLAGMKGTVLNLTGDKQLIRNLNGIRDSVARRAIKKGLTKAVRLAAKAMKAAVPVNLKGMKPAIAGRIGVTKRKGLFFAKAGAAVGKAFKKEAKTPKSGKRKGVGIGGRNVHWWILGTGPRTVEKTGKYVGAMPAMAPDVIKQGFAASSGQAAAAIKSEIAAELAKPRKVR
jgi:hypothetical protein